jgi:hypothetical protein
MAVQLAVAYSSIIKGVGVVAAGPYYCSQNDLLIATSRCSCTIQPSSACQVSQTSTNVPKLVSLTRVHPTRLACPTRRCPVCSLIGGLSRRSPIDAPKAAKRLQTGHSRRVDFKWQLLYRSMCEFDPELSIAR